MAVTITVKQSCGHSIDLEFRKDEYVGPEENWQTMMGGIPCVSCGGAEYAYRLVYSCGHVKNRRITFMGTVKLAQAVIAARVRRASQKPCKECTTLEGDDGATLDVTTKIDHVDVSPQQSQKGALTQFIEGMGETLIEGFKQGIAETDKKAALTEEDELAKLTEDQWREQYRRKNMQRISANRQKTGMGRLTHEESTKLMTTRTSHEDSEWTMEEQRRLANTTITEQPYEGFTLFYTKNSRPAIRCNDCLAHYEGYGYGSRDPNARFKGITPSSVTNHKYSCQKLYAPSFFTIQQSNNADGWYKTKCKYCTGGSVAVKAKLKDGRYEFKPDVSAVYHAGDCSIFVPHHRVQRELPGSGGDFIVKDEASIALGRNALQSVSVRCVHCDVSKYVSKLDESATKYMRHSPDCPLHPAQRKAADKAFKAELAKQAETIARHAIERANRRDRN